MATITEVLETVDELKPNQYLDAEKIKWISKLDGIVKSEIIDKHEGGSEIPWEPYDETTDGDTVLLVPEPYSSMYQHYIEAQIDYHNAEYTRYNNSSAIFNMDYEDYAKAYRREHMPIAKATKYKNLS